MIRASLAESNPARASRGRNGMAVLCALAVSSLGSNAFAQEQESPSSGAAELLFTQGRDLMKERRYDEACAAFENSEELEPASGTLLNLGVCREAQGRTASAFRSYRAGLALSQVEKNPAAERLARDRLTAIEPRLCRVVLTIRSPRPGLAVRLDGVPVYPSSWGKPEPIDPGPHRVESNAPDQELWSTEFTIESAGTLKSIEIESPRASPSMAPERRGVVANSGPSRTEPQPPKSIAPAGHAENWPVLLTGGVAVAGVLGTVYFGVLATKQWDRRNEHCGDGQCDRFAVLASESASRYARAADIALGVAALSGATAISLVIFESRKTHGSGARSQIRLGNHGTSLHVAGDF